MRDQEPSLQLWQGKATVWDKILIMLVFVLPFVYLALLPLRPWMLANAPLWQALINGARTSIVASGAFASTGAFPLWLVIVVGLFGRVKFDWAMWLAGKRWGDNLIALMTGSKRKQKQAEKLTKMPPWLLFLFTFLAATPGVPGPLVYTVAGYSGMRLPLFLAANILGSLVFICLYAWLGYHFGEAVVDVLKVVDKYAIGLMLVIIVGIFVWTYIKQSRAASEGK